MIKISQMEVANSVFEILHLYAKGQRLLEEAQVLGLYDFASTEEDSYGREALQAVKEGYERTVLTYSKPGWPLLQTVSVALYQGEAMFRYAKTLAEWGRDLDFSQCEYPAHRRKLENLVVDLKAFKDAVSELY